MLDTDWSLELFPGGRTSSSEGYVAVTLARHCGFSPLQPLHVKFSITIRNQLKASASVTRSVSEMSSVPGEMGIDQDDKARVGWDDFIRWSDLLDPSQGFVVLGELCIDADIHPFGGVFVKAKPKQPKGDSLLCGMQSLFQSK